MKNWQSEPVYESMTLQVGEAPAYRFTWEIRDGYTPLVAIERRATADGAWLSSAYYPVEDAGAAEVALAAARLRCADAEATVDGVFSA
jgi:hypothetical protein